MADICVVEAEPADIPALAGLLAELFTLESDFRPDLAKQEQGLRLIVENPATGRIFVLRAGGRIVGMASALFTVSTAEGGPVVLLEDVIVAEGYRGRGLGRKLVGHVLDWARDNGFRRVTLLADRDNDLALRFYEGLGFGPSCIAVYRYWLTAAP
jgi:GNAT superfamily N-acetyltransferase